jgi:hypothetical protein
MKKVMDPTTIKRSLVNSRRANATAKIRRTEPKVKKRERQSIYMP